MNKEELIDSKHAASLLEMIQHQNQHQHQHQHYWFGTTANSLGTGSFSSFFPSSHRIKKSQKSWKTINHSQQQAKIATVFYRAHAVICGESFERGHLMYVYGYYYGKSTLERDANYSPFKAKRLSKSSLWFYCKYAWHSEAYDGSIVTCSVIDCTLSCKKNIYIYIYTQEYLT